MTAKTSICKYGHVKAPADTYCKVCSSIRSGQRRKRVDANWKAPVYRELATQPWIPIEDPSAGPDGPDASDPYATVSTPPGTDCAESRVEGSSMGISA